MNGKNLLPIPRQAALLRRRAVRRWSLINGMYFGLLVVAGTAYAIAMFARERTTAEPADLAALNSTLVSVRQQQATLTTNLRAVQDITQRPDWSILLAVIAGALEDGVVLSGLDAAAPSEPANPLADPHRVRLSATATSQAAVSAFVLRLEALGLFSRVQLEKTSAQTTRDAAGVRFQLTCSLIEEAVR